VIVDSAAFFFSLSLFGETAFHPVNGIITCQLSLSLKPFAAHVDLNEDTNSPLNIHPSENFAEIYSQ